MGSFFLIFLHPDIIWQLVPNKSYNLAPVVDDEAESGQEGKDENSDNLSSDSLHDVI